MTRLLPRPFEAIGKTLRNRGLFGALRRFAFPKHDRDRPEGLREVHAWLVTKSLELGRTENLDEAKGFARALLDQGWLRRQLDETHHLGALTKLTYLRITRLDYVRLQLELLFKLREQDTGLGLGSSNDGTGAVRYRQKVLSGLELTQSWAILTSVGHLFGTFATERALLMQVAAARDLEQVLIDGVDPQLRDAATRILAERSAYGLVNVLAAWRISRAELPADVRATAMSVFGLYLDREPSIRVRRLRDVFKIVRRAAYLQLHQHMGLPSVGGMTRDIAAPVRTLLENDGIAFESHAKPDAPLRELTEAIDEYQHRTFFTSTEAARLVLSHGRSFDEWWAAQHGHGSTLPSRIDALFSQPTDWREHAMEMLRPVARIDLPWVDADWFKETAAWASEPCAWGSCTFLITYTPNNRRLFCDVFATDAIEASAAFNVTSRLAAHCERSWAERGNHQVLWRSVAAFGRSLFRELVRDGRGVRLRPVRADPGVGYATAARTAKQLVTFLQSFVPRLQENGSKVKAAELAALADYLTSLPENEHTRWLCFLGTLLIVDDTNGEERQEIDALAAELTEQRVVWHALEVKGGSRAGAVGQLSELAQHVTGELTGPRRYASPHGHAVIFTITWPAAAKAAAAQREAGRGA